MPFFVFYPASSNTKFMRFRRMQPTFQIAGTERMREKDGERERERKTERHVLLLNIQILERETNYYK